MMKNLGPNVFSYGYPAPVLMVCTYNDDGTVNVMNLHEIFIYQITMKLQKVWQRQDTELLNNSGNRNRFLPSLHTGTYGT